MRRRLGSGGAAFVAFVLSGGAALAHGSFDDKPWFIRGEILEMRHARLDEEPRDDLLTAGLGASGLGDPTPPPVSDPPTVFELRRLAIYNNYRAWSTRRQAAAMAGSMARTSVPRARD